MKIALAQLDVKAGRPKLNVKRMLEMIEEAKETGAELIAFPEMAVGGYMIGDKFTDDMFLDNLEVCHNMLIEAADGIVVVFGSVYVDYDEKGLDGRNGKFNTAYVCENKKVIRLAHKTLLPTYRIFDDRRYFKSADDLDANGNKTFPNIPVKLSNGITIGVEVCEDMWHEDYGNNITEKLVDAGADFIINVSCSPWTYGKANARDKVIKRMKDGNNKFVPFYYVNACGVQNNGKNIITFDGDSRAYNSDGYKLQNHLKPYEEGILYFNKHDVEFTRRDLLPEMSMIEEKEEAIIRAYKGLDEMMGFKPNFIFGASGGVDSSISIYLAVKAVGKDRVKCFNLPSRYNSEKTKDAAKELCEKLGVSYSVVPIELVTNAVTKTLKNANGDGKSLSSLVEENIQAKARGTSILSNLAAINGGVMVNNGNKLETALGYATLYGDVNGVFAPLGDLTKVEIFDMCKLINNREGEIIPKAMLPINDLYDFDGIAPSAELKEDQLDPIKFGYHDRLIEEVMNFKKSSMDDFATAYFNCELRTDLGISEALWEKYNLNDPKVFIDDLEWFFRQIQRNVFKRIQAPPIVLLSKTAYGFDYRESQFAFETSFYYDDLRKDILEMES